MVDDGTVMLKNFLFKFSSLICLRLAQNIIEFLCLVNFHLLVNVYITMENHMFYWENCL